MVIDAPGKPPSKQGNAPTRLDESKHVPQSQLRGTSVAFPPDGDFDDYSDSTGHRGRFGSTKALVVCSSESRQDCRQFTMRPKLLASFATLNSNGDDPHQPRRSTMRSKRDSKVCFLRLSGVLLGVVLLMTGPAHGQGPSELSSPQLLPAPASSRDSLAEMIRHEPPAEERPSHASDWSSESNERARPSADRSTAARLMRLNKPITEIKIDLYVDDESVPDDLASRHSPPQEEVWITALAVEAPRPDRYTIGFMHRPLYYQQPNLERCGRSFDYFQNAVSGIQFLANTIVLPYKMAKNRPDCPVPSRGDCQSCQAYPSSLNPLPLDCQATLTEAATLAGFSFLLL